MRRLAYLVRLLPALVVIGAAPLFAVELAPLGERFAPSKDTQGSAEAPLPDEVPSFQRHVVPLFGRLGCNGRSCHGSFQGQGGFRLSMFGYDFAADHDALTKPAADADNRPRVDLKLPAESLILKKPASEDDHGGGRRFDIGGWEYRVLRKWIAAGAKNDARPDVTLNRLVVAPAEILFDRLKTEPVALRVRRASWLSSMLGEW